MFWPSHCFACCFQGRKLLVRLEQTHSFGRAICFSRVLPDCDCGSVTWENQFCRSLKCGEEDFECLSTFGLIYRGVHYIYACMCTVSHVHTCVYISIYIWCTVSNPLILVMKSCLSRSTPFVFVSVHQLVESWCFTHPWEISKTSETPKTKNRHGNNMETTDIKHPWAWNDVKRRETAGTWPESVRTRPIECIWQGFEKNEKLEKAKKRNRPMGQWNDIDQLEKGTRHGMPRPPRETGHVSGVEVSQFRFEMFIDFQ